MRMLDCNPTYHDWRSQDVGSKGKQNQAESNQSTLRQSSLIPAPKDDKC